MASGERRGHERIDIEMPTRMWINEERGGKLTQFEGFARTRDLSIGGTFIESSYLLPLGMYINIEMRMEEHGNEILAARGEVVHVVSDDACGMGILFTEVDSENRERLLRFFISDRIKEFYHERFVVEFPHLEKTLTLKDVALTINLWEDKEGRISAMRKVPGEQIQKVRRDAEVEATKRRSKPARR